MGLIIQDLVSLEYSKKHGSHGGVEKYLCGDESTLNRSGMPSRTLDDANCWECTKQKGQASVYKNAERFQWSF